MQPDKLGPYKILSRLGKGGMGAVYRGVSDETHQDAAIKVLARELGHDSDFRHRFASEIATLRRLNHPNIVRLFGFGEQDGQLFYAMELVDGVSLEEEIKRGRRFKWQEVAQIGSETCRALRHAHDRGVIHRDIKPANLLLASDGTTRLSDFGIARLFGSTGMTTAGSVIGTVEYMSPEQADGRPVDHRADLYSLGGVMYALLAGRSPFVAKNLPEMLHKQRYAMPEPVAELVTDLPADFSALISKLLAKNPEERFPNALVLGRHLEALLTTGSTRSASLVSNNNSGGSRGANNSQGDSGDKQDEDGDVDFDVEQTAQKPAVHDPEAFAVTRDIGESGLADSTSSAAAADGEYLPETKATDIFQAFVPEPEGKDERKEATDNKTLTDAKKTAVDKGLFTVVPKEELGRVHSPREEKHALISAQTWVLAAALLIMGMIAWYALRPPSADALYERIVAQTADGKTDSILAAKADIEKFLLNHADDPRCKSLLKYEREIRLEEMRRTIYLRAKVYGKTDELLPIERAYLEARNYASLSPELGLKKFEALVDLYGHGTDITGPTGQCLELARREIEKLREELGRSSADHLAMLNGRLDRADELIDSDPQEATAIWKAAIELYAQKPWAAQAVRRARSALEKAETAGAAVTARNRDEKSHTQTQ